MWWSQTSQGYWCNFCGDLLKPEFHFESDEDREEYESALEDSNCPACGAPDEFVPDAFI